MTKLQFRILYREFLFRVVDLELLSPHAQGDASKILGQCACQLPDDWELCYGYRPLLLETLVDARRFRGTCYRAANWIWVGQTQGRGRMDSEHRAHGLAPKDIYLYPLCRNVPQKLRQHSNIATLVGRSAD